MILEVSSNLAIYDFMVFCDTPMKKPWSQRKVLMSEMAT